MMSDTKKSNGRAANDISAYKNYKEFYNEQANMVIDFCKEHKKVFHIKTGTITE